MYMWLINMWLLMQNASAQVGQEMNANAEAAIGLGVSWLWLVGMVVLFVALMFVPRFISRGDGRR